MSDETAPVPIPQPGPPKDWRQLDYEGLRRAWRAEVETYLEERELPGSPFTPIWSALP